MLRRPAVTEVHAQHRGGGHALHALEPGAHLLRAEARGGGGEGDGQGPVPGEPARGRGIGEEGLDLGRHDDALVGAVVVQRLDAETVTRQDELSAGPVPEDDREHAAYVAQEVQAVPAVEVEQDLAVGTGLQPYVRGKPGGQLLVVVHLAVGDQDEVAVVTDERLSAVLRIHQGQPREGEAHRSAAQQLALVGAPVVQKVGEIAQEGVELRPEILSVEPSESCESTHE